MRMILLVTLGLVLFLASAGCDSDRPDPKKPVTITMWHNYGGQMQSVMDELIDELTVLSGGKKALS